MPIHSASYSLAIISLTLNGIAYAADNEDAGYPAPPGVYGQDKLFNDTHFNLGKGSPYIILEKSDNQAEDAMPPQPVISPEKISTSSPESEAPVYQPAKITTPGSSKPSISERDEVFYPEAEEIRQQYLQAESLPFDQWGHENLDYGDPSVPINTSPNWQTYPDRQSDRLTQTYINTGNWPDNRTTQTESRYINPGYTMQQFFNTPNNTNWVPASNAYLTPFEQFPVPQNPYGFSSATSSMPGTGLPAGTNLQYLPKIPEEEIIYPPSYPGKRPGN